MKQSPRYSELLHKELIPVVKELRAKIGFLDGEKRKILEDLRNIHRLINGMDDTGDAEKKYFHEIQRAKDKLKELDPENQRLQMRD